MLVDRLSQRWFISAYPFTRFKILVLDLRLNPWIQIQLGFNSPLVVFGGLFLKDAKSVLKDWLFTYHSFILSFFFFFYISIFLDWKYLWSCFPPISSLIRSFFKPVYFCVVNVVIRWICSHVLMKWLFCFTHIHACVYMM